jgi:hypothetical protein
MQAHKSDPVQSATDAPPDPSPDATSTSAATAVATAAYATSGLLALYGRDP